MKKSMISIIALYFIVIILWVLAWLLKLNILDKTEFFITSFGGFIYWTFSKILIWILPFLIYFKIKKINIVEDMKTNDKNWLKWGAIIGSVIAALNILYNVITKHEVLNVEFSFAYLNIAITAPLLEEIMFRGFILNMLKKELPFYIANIITSVFFLILHIPGWFFMGVLKTNLLNYTFVSIFFLSLIFGYAYKKGNSVKASILVHFLNNIT